MNLDIGVGFVFVRRVVLVTLVAATTAPLFDRVEPTRTACFDAVLSSDHALVGLLTTIGNTPTELTAALPHLSRYKAS
jgi:hypothetical protein